MTDFKKIQKDINAARAVSEISTNQLTGAKEKLRSIEKVLKEAVRVSGPNGSDAITAFQRKKEGLEREIKALDTANKTNKDRVFELLGTFTQLEDTTRQVEQLDDAYPFLLFPLRLETRFKKITTNGIDQNQLWIRIYPDDCQVEIKEDMLSESEITSAQSFWKEMWQAGGTEEEERGAWRTLVSNFGSGRASWIIEKYNPLNPGDKKTKADKKDIVLVISPETLLNAADETAAFSFWKKLWLADKNMQQQNQAMQELIATVGNDKALEITSRFRPFNMNVTPPSPWKRSEVTVNVVKINFPSKDDITAASSSWLQAPKAKTLPDRFVVMCYNNNVLVKQQTGNPVPDNLATGPDPSLSENEQLKATTEGNLFINKDLAWMVDFEKAIAVGMGMKINLTPAEAGNGFQKILVLGLRLSSDQEAGRKSLENLFSNHYYAKHGFGLLKQGTPTNNTEKEASGYTGLDDTESSYDIIFKQKEAYEEKEDFLEKKDGQWLSEYLGIDNDLFKKVPNGAGTDQGEARAMNMALSPATLGYFMQEMMHPVFTEKDISSTRFFFSYFISGRGPVPAIRIGKQPYGILPATAFSRLQFNPTNDSGTGVDISANDNYLLKLYNILKKMDADWETLVPSVSHVGKSGDTEQMLLDILGLHPGSVEFYQRYVESLQHLYNQVVLYAGQQSAARIANLTVQKAGQIFQQIGFNFSAAAPILEKYFLSAANPLKGPLIDDVPLSESSEIRKYSADGKNYIGWLATSNVEKVRLQDFGGQPVPTALLYLLLRHALMLVQADAAVQLHITKGLETDKANSYDPAFIHVKTEGGGKSKWEYLYKKEPSITGDDMLVSDHIYKKNILQGATETQQLRDLIKSLEFLESTPTARLERAFAEHLDCCHYRLDAWKTGLVNYKLIEQRRLRNANNTWSKGIYLGCYGWLEEVRPEQKVLTPVTLNDELNLIFKGDEPLVKDDKNLGYIHAPSLNQAATAAILRNAYDTNKNNDANTPNPFAINLSSERVRLANQFIEGIRNGQSLSALLGYQFERGLHDKYSLGKGEVDKFIYPLRQKFPLVANHLQETQTTADENKETSIDSIEARNVIDGLKLIRHIQSATEKTYPFGLPVGTDNDQVPAANNTQKQAITEEAQRIMDINDAIADMVTAESVYQVVQGNFERSAGNMDAFSKGSYPPEIEVVQTPRSGITLTQRVGLQFDTAADPGLSPTSVANMTARASAEPSVNKWMASILPPPENVLCKVTYQTPDNPAVSEKPVSQKDLGLQPIDLLYLMNLDTEQSMTALDDAIVQHIRTHDSLHPGAEVRIEYTAIIDKDDRSKISFFELSALVKSLRKLLVQSRPLNAGDIALPGEFQTDAVQYAHAQLQQRIADAKTALINHAANLLNLSTDGADIDEYIRKVSAEFISIALHSIPQTGTGFMFDSLGNVYRSVTNKITAVVERWKQKKIDYDAAIAEFTTATDDTAKTGFLQKAERLISAIFTFPLPDLITYKNSIDGKKDDFDTVFDQLNDLLVSGTTVLNDYFDEVDTVITAISNHDAIFFDTKKEKNDVSSEREMAVNLKEQIKTSILNLKNDLDKRIADVDAIFTSVAAIPGSSEKVQQLIIAAKKVLGDEVIILPHFSLAGDQGDEWENSFGSSDQLLTYLKNDLHTQYPVDDWLYGIARVREKLFHLENTIALTQGFTPAVDVTLTPVQFPFKTADRWLAMQFRNKDESFKIETDTLLYTAHFAVAFNKNQLQCGVLVDDWTEVIPSKEETTGISFHYDQPDTEPPQVMLLAVPPAFTGKWHWNDLVDTLHETLAMAKKRAVEPQQLDGTGYAQFLPATLMAVTLYSITVATNLASNNMVYDKLNTSSN